MSMADSKHESAYIGRPLRRKEDPRLLRGMGCFVADVRLPGMVEAAILRSTRAHARLTRLDVTGAQGMAGVHAVVTAKDLVERVEPLHASLYKKTPPALEAAVRPLTRKYEAPLLAKDRVLRFGEPIGVVVADNRYLAEDALDRILVEYEPLPVVSEPEQALVPDAPVLHPEFGDNIHGQFRVEAGNVERALANADFVLKERIRVPRQIGSPIETRGIVAWFEHGRQPRLTVWSTTQYPHNLRGLLAEVLHLPESLIHVIAPDMGGSFGSGIYNEEVLVPYIAMVLGRPVRWIEDRLENLANARHSRDQVHDVEIGFSRDGTITGLRDRFLVDMGAYSPFGLTCPYNTAAHMRGQYKIVNFEAEGICIATNKLQNTPVRGAGRPEGTFVMDRLVDMIAAGLNLDPAEVRRRNLIPAEAMPYDMGMPYRDGAPLVYDSGDFPTQFETALRHVGYEALRAEQETLRKQGRRVGVGMSSGVEGTGYGPHEGAVARLDPDGRVLVLSGCSPHGQSHETTLSQVAADAFGVSPDRVSVLLGDSDLLQYGAGTFASRSAVTAGTAVHVAAQRLRQKVLKVAGELLEINPHDLELVGDRIAPRGVPSHSVSLAEVAQAAAPGPNCRVPEGNEPGLEAQYYYVPPTVTFASSTHAAVVEVDEETGVVSVLRYVVVHDCGRVLHPLVVGGQIAGGVAHGLGNALLEEALYSKEGQFLTNSFLDYLLPTATDVPPIDVVHQEHLSPLNPLGVKGCGEGGATSPPAALANAVVDALRPLPVHITGLPLSPERVLQAIREAKQQSA